jgi:hypothetical protein
MLMHGSELSDSQRPPTRAELLDLLETLELALSSMAGRWQGGIPAEVRAEIMTEAYEPALKALIRAKRRPLPR